MRREGRSDFEVMLHGEMRLMHGYPMGKDEVSFESQLFLGFGPWAENVKGKRKILGFCP